MAFSPPKKTTAYTLNSDKRSNSNDTRGTTAKSSVNMLSGSRPRINNSVYLNKDYYRQINGTTVASIIKSHIRPFEGEEQRQRVQPQSGSARKPFFGDDHPLSGPLPSQSDGRSRVD